ncbi:MAG: DUF4173 domain-containing protein [Acidobacteria bacterium]|nr:DUF4173 domain-containing protein [Acidobacteriota bacterium]
MNNEPSSPSSVTSGVTSEQSGYQSVLTPAPGGPLYESVLPAPPAASTSVASPVTPSPATQRGLFILAIALGSGLAGDWLLRATPWGVNLSVWLTITATGAWFVFRHEDRTNPTLYWFALPLGFFSLALAWRDSLTLQALDVGALLVTLLLLMMHKQRGRLRYEGLVNYVTSGFELAAETAIGMLLLVFGDIGWRELPRNGWSARAFAIGRGLALAVPVLAVFGGLLMAADAMFENLVFNAFSFDASALVLHLFVAGCVTWLVGGYLHGLLSASALSKHKAPVSAAQTASGFFSLGIIETGIVLGLLNLLFLAFVLVQFRYLFLQGAEFAPDAGTAFSNYARRGFFELVWVSLLVLPLLLGMHWLLRKDQPRNETIFRALASTQIALLFVIMASAIKRMLLYHECCGLTELRIYTLAFQLWLAVVFLWFIATVLRGQRERFATGAVIAGLCIIAALHILNPDNLIARVNLARARDGRHTDIPYTVSLSADSVPALVAGLNGLSATDQQQLRTRLRERDWSGGATGWRSWNWSRVRAYQLVQSLTAPLATKN